MKRILVILMLYINLGVGQEVAAPLVIESGEPFLTEGELVRIVEEFVGGVDSQSVKTEGERVYEIGFPEEGKEESNIIELAVENGSVETVEGIKVIASVIPEGISFKEEVVELSRIEGGKEEVARFEFKVDKAIRINKEHRIIFMIVSRGGERWMKEVKLKVGAPVRYELYQNYPNPFNTSTVITYQLPEAGSRYFVLLKIYDILGREVAELVKGEQEAGYYRVRLDASNYCSGIYIYRLMVRDSQGKKVSFSKKMLLVK